MAKKQQFSVRLPSDTAEALEEYAEENELSNADALRRACEDFYLGDDEDSAGSDQLSRLEQELERRERQSFLRELSVVAGLVYLAALVVVDLPSSFAVVALGGLVLAVLVHVGYWTYAMTTTDETTGGGTAATGD
jgi:hypothetical protein